MKRQTAFWAGRWVQAYFTLPVAKYVKRQTAFWAGRWVQAYFTLPVAKYVKRQTAFWAGRWVQAWFKSYLYDRFQTVSVNNIQSNPVKPSYGVPQGSVLGPVLFILYTSPLASIINRHDLNHHFYADHTQLLNSALPENIHILLKTTSDCYLDIKHWMTQNKFRLDCEKTEPMLVGTRQNLFFILVKTLQLDHTTDPFSDSVKSLGVLLYTFIIIIISRSVVVAIVVVVVVVVVVVM